MHFEHKITQRENRNIKLSLKSGEKLYHYFSFIQFFISFLIKEILFILWGAIWKINDASNLFKLCYVLFCNKLAGKVVWVCALYREKPAT